MWSAVNENSGRASHSHTNGNTKPALSRWEKSGHTRLTCLLMGWPWGPESQPRSTLYPVFWYLLIQLHLGEMSGKGMPEAAF